MRILLAVLSPLNPELGASQMALNLGRALRERGVDAVVWSPCPVPPGVRWWRRMAWMRKAIADHVERNGPFDLVDVPPVAVSRALARHCAVVARHVQPDLLYLWAELRFGGRLRRIRFQVRVADLLFKAYLGALVIAGWFRAWRILCLGALDHRWMIRWFPWWRGKTRMYVNAIEEHERHTLAAIRQNRRAPAGPGTRYLWLGRWAAHKGNDLLIEFMSRHLPRRLDDRITIAGCGPEARSQIPAPLVESGRVNIVDAYDRAQLPGLLASHDAGLFTSRTEGWGLTLQEMLESGMPVYANPAGAAYDLREEFASQLRAFPPRAGDAAPAFAAHDPSAGYLERFSWAGIAADYLRQVDGVVRR